MNKKDIAAIRRQFKLDTDLLTIHDIYNVYIRQESSDIYHEVRRSFCLLDREQQELFLTNFKKVLSGKLGAKLFEVKFRREVEAQEEDAQSLLYDGLHADDIEEWQEQMRQLACKMVEEKQYEKDLVVTFIRGDYYQPTKRHTEETEIADRDEVYTTPFILCSMNQTEQPKRTLVFDFIEKKFKSSFVPDPIINLTSPIGGFLFPCFTNHAADVNHFLYAAGKTNQPDFHFIEEVLDGEEIMTAADDKAVFEEIVKDVIGEQVNVETIANVYEEINRMMEVEEEEEDTEESTPTLDRKEIERVLKVSGVEEVNAEKVQAAFEKVVDDPTYEMKANHIVPSYTSKSIKINTKVANISISPQDLKYVRQVTVNGKRCLLIEVEEDTVIDGFTIVPQELLK